MGGFSPPPPPPRKEHPLALAHSGTRHVEPPLLSGQPERAPGGRLAPSRLHTRPSHHSHLCDHNDDLHSW